jgi:hypothetical protein
MYSSAVQYPRSAASGLSRCLICAFPDISPRAFQLLFLPVTRRRAEPAPSLHRMDQRDFDHGHGYLRIA